MNKIHKFATALAIIGTVGLTYAVLMLKGMPEVLDWEDDNEDIF
jgi:hypothetical protein